MPRVSIPITDTDTTITRLVAQSVIRQLIDLTMVEKIDEITYIPRGGVQPLPQINKPAEPLNLDVVDRVIVEYRKTYKTDDVDIPAYKTEYPAYFNIPQLGISFAPAYSRVSLELTLKYTSKNYDQLTIWRNAFRRRSQTHHDVNHHDILFNYNIPDSVCAYIYQVWKLTETIAPYGDTLAQYFLKYVTNQGLVIRESMDGVHNQLAINTKQVGCLGYFDNEPDIQDTSREPPLSTLSFTYKIEYDDINSFILCYQIYIHNQVIDLKYIIDFMSRYTQTKEFKSTKIISQGINVINETRSDLRALTAPALAEDRYPVTRVYDFMEPIDIIPISIDILDLRTVINLSDLIPDLFTADVTQLITMYMSGKSEPYNNFIHFQLLEVDDYERLFSVTVLPTGELRSTIDMDLRSRHYLVIYKVYDFRKFNWGVYRTKIPDVMTLLTFLKPGFTFNFEIKNYISDRDILKLITLFSGVETTLQQIKQNLFGAPKYRRR